MDNGTQKTNWYKWRRLFVFFMIGFVLLMKFQNCAPAPKALAGGPERAEVFPVTTIDDVNLTTGISFPQEKLALKTETEAAEIEGICDITQHGSVLGWRIFDSSGEEVGRGYAACESGRFLVELAPTQEFICDQPYKVAARLGMGDEGAVEVSRSCHRDI
ncbi:MAG: hypothetical protein V4692_07755 [Bdellovibrionota bacterium]